MNLEKFTNRSREALVNAQNLAISSRHTQLSDLHLLKSLLEQNDGLAGSIMSKLDIDIKKLIAAVDDALNRLPRFSGNGNGELPQIPHIIVDGMCACLPFIGQVTAELFQFGHDIQIPPDGSCVM